MLDAMSAVPAYIRNGRLDLLAGNSLARALFAPIFTSPARPVNAARFTFLDPAAAGFYPDWDAVADQNVATLRAEVGRNPYDKALSDLIGELSTRGDTFRQRWAQHEVRRHRAGAKRLNHPLVGQLTFNYETMELAADDGLHLIVCTATPGSRDAEALSLLASWDASAPPNPAHKPDRSRPERTGIVPRKHENCSNYVCGEAAVREPGSLARAAVGGAQGPEIGFGEVEPGGRIADRGGPAGPGERHDVR